MSGSLLLFFLLLRPGGAGGCLHCDRPFLRRLGVLLGEVLPSEVPNRDTLIQRHVQAFERLYSTHLHKKHHRVLDVRGVLAAKAALTSWLRALKETPWKGVHLLQLTLAQHRDSLRNRLRGALEHFADLACSEDCKEDPRDAERNEIILYLFLVCQSVLLASAALLYWVCCRHRR
ncbi:izumo sperm-egg fusion protein 3 isoform X2 [Pelodiscus sinensis]|uniref:izumo sperm-egg fusion protein 3 isoform X2 n=1 Tax=Pelodiscus sinensis TaxID=13735 RepID=UPI003F6D635C